MDTSAAVYNHSNDPKLVEKQLSRTCSKLAEAATRVELFSRMVRNGVATNDVRCFVAKQSDMKRVNQQFNKNLSKAAMKHKLSDAYAEVKR